MSLVNFETGEVVEVMNADAASAVYVFVDVSDAAIYVGATKDAARRVREHRGKSWWPLVADVYVFPQRDWLTALATERELIHELSPEFNRQSVDDDRWTSNFLFGSMRRDLWKAFYA